MIENTGNFVIGVAEETEIGPVDDHLELKEEGRCICRAEISSSDSNF